MIRTKTQRLLDLIVLRLAGGQTEGGPIAAVLNTFGTCVGETSDPIAHCQDNRSMSIRTRITGRSKAKGIKDKC